MSYTTIIAVFPGDKAVCSNELRNSHGSAPVVWDALSKRYLGWDIWMRADMSDLWNLWKDKSIPEAHRAVLMMTFDKAYVAREHYKRAANDIDKFLADFPEDPNKVNHWPAIAIMFHNELTGIPGTGFWHTSVSENPFAGRWNDEKEEYDPPDWSEIYSIYDELDKLKEKDGDA